MQPFQFQSRIWLARPIAEVFQFFSDAKNLQQITPPLLDFRVTAMSTERIESGTRIDYKLKIRGFPVRWQSEITEWEPPHRFVDRQLRGPYALWLHEHRFRAQDGGTQCEDVVRYLPPRRRAACACHQQDIRGEGCRAHIRLPPTTAAGDIPLESRLG